MQEQSYRACAWVSLAALKSSAQRFPGVLTRLRNFQARGHERAAGGADSDTDDDAAGMVHGVRPEWRVVDRVIACRRAGRAREYLCKWKELGYEESTWEAEASLHDFAAEVQLFHQRGPIDAANPGAAAAPP